MARRPAATSFAVGDVVIDVPRLKVTRRDMPIDLTTTEFQLLTRSRVSPAGYLPARSCSTRCAASKWTPFERAIDAHIKNIRHKLEPDSRKPRYVLTVYGAGYKFAES